MSKKVFHRALSQGKNTKAGKCIKSVIYNWNNDSKLKVLQAQMRINIW